MQWLKEKPINTPGLRPYQKEAIQAFENKLEEALGITPNTLKIIAIKDFYWPMTNKRSFKYEHNMFLLFSFRLVCLSHDLVNSTGATCNQGFCISFRLKCFKKIFFSANLEIFSFLKNKEK